MKSIQKQKRLLSIGEAADYLGVSIDTLRRWEKRGRIEPLRSPGNHRYYPIESLDKLFGKKYQHDATKVKAEQGARISEALNHETHQTPKTYTDKELTPTAQSHPPASSFSKLSTFTNKIVDRPVRQVNIPVTERVKIIKTEKIQTTDNTLKITQEQITSAGVLTPAGLENTASQQIPESKIIIERPIRKRNKILTYLALVAFILLVIAVVFFLIGYSSQKMLSPVP